MCVCVCVDCGLCVCVCVWRVCVCVCEVTPSLGGGCLITPCTHMYSRGRVIGMAVCLTSDL